MRRAQLLLTSILLVTGGCAANHSSAPGLPFGVFQPRRIGPVARGWSHHHHSFWENNYGHAGNDAGSTPFDRHGHRVGAHQSSSGHADHPHGAARHTASHGAGHRGGRHRSGRHQGGGHHGGGHHGGGHH